MTELLRFLVEHLGFLWEGGRYRIVDSITDGFNAMVVVESSVLRLRFTRDKAQLFLDLQPVTSRSAREEFSVDLVKRLMTGETALLSGVLDEEYAAYVGRCLPDIEALFGPERWLTTHDELVRIRRVRSKQMWG